MFGRDDEAWRPRRRGMLSGDQDLGIGRWANHFHRSQIPWKDHPPPLDRAGTILTSSAAHRL